MPTTITATLAPIALPPCPTCGAATERTYGAGLACSALITYRDTWERANLDTPDRKVTPFTPPCAWSGVRSTFDVPRDNVADLVAAFAKLSKRAAKCGCPAPSLALGETWTQTVTKDGVAHVSEYVRVTVSGESPQIDGWTFAAKIDHDPAGNVLASALRGEELPRCYRTAAPVCEHCNLTRRRNATYVLRHLSGEWRQVGASCLADFTGHRDPEALAASAEYLWDALAIAEGACEEGSGGGAYRGYDVLPYLVRVAQAIRLDGWVSRKTAENHGFASTCDTALALLCPGRGMPPSPRPEDIDRERAEKALAWARAIDPVTAGDYEWNLRTSAHRAIVTAATMGILASAIVAWDRTLAVGPGRATRKASEWIGTVKADGDKRYKRPTLRLTVERVIVLESQWGNSYRHIFRDADGNVATWKASGVCLDELDTYDVTCTIEAHDVYLPRDAAPGAVGVKQTKLGRCKAVKVAPPVAEEQAA